MKVDLKQIIRDNRLDRQRIGELLFPKLLHPNKKLQQLFAGNGELNASQLLTLSRFLGVSVDQLYTEDGFQVIRNQGDISIVNSDLEARYSIDKSTITITRGKQVEEFLAPGGFTSVPDFIKFVEFLTQKF